MPVDVASELTPRLSWAKGGPLGLLFLGGPGPLRRPWRRAVTRLRTGRLPAFLATYPDGRRFLVEAGDRMYEQVYRLGEYEPVVTKTIRALLEPGDVAVDVGANHGWHALVMARTVGPGGCVHALEPVPPLATALRRNLRLNPGARVQVHDVAAAAAAGELELHTFEDLPHGHASAATFGRARYTTHVARCARLDELLTDPPALIKVDVEGLEPEVVEGAAGLMREGSGPMWLIEVNHETAAAFGRRPDAALAELPAGYALFRVEPEGVVQESAPAAAPHGATWLCVPDALAGRARPLLGPPTAA